LVRAAIRRGRFVALVEVGFPDTVQAGRILSALLQDVPGGDGVDVGAVAAALPASTSGSDLREIVRRAVLMAGDTWVSTDQLLGEVGSGRYQARPPDGGMYL
jgi:SpoVK/Ycf46/Vps4 family AAA+-type ATPase